MRESEFLKLLRAAAFAVCMAFVGVSVPAAVAAQDARTPTTQDLTYDEEDDGMDWGWLGLLGLAGLLGLRKREPPHYTTSETTTRRT